MNNNALNITFKFKEREWQKKHLLYKTLHRSAVHRRAGKTTLAVAELIISALKHPNALYAYVAPELKQARIIAWDCMKQMTQQFLSVKDGKQKVSLIEVHETEPYIQFWNGARIMLFGADKPDRMRGVKLAGAIIDEVAQMPREMWFDIVRPALMDSKGWALFIGTPKGINLFSELYDNANNLEDWACAKFTCYETGALDADELEAYKREVSEEVFRREMLCDFTASASNQLISLFDAEAAAHKTIDPKFLGNAPLVLGVDVARFGADRSVLFFRQSVQAYEPIIVQDVDLVTLASIIKEHVAIRRPKAIFVDGTGVGGGVVDILRSWGIDSYDINFGHKSTDRAYANKRTEMWCKMADWLRKGGILPNIPALVEELSMPLYDVTERNEKILESKAKMRERCGKSPDLADALALTFAIEIEAEKLTDENGFFVRPEKRDIAADYLPTRSYEEDVRTAYKNRYRRAFWE